MNNQNALQIRDENLSSDTWRIITEQSQMLLKSGFLPQSIKTPEQALAIILQGRELGIPTMAALGTINVIQGKPTVSPQLMLALINRSGQLENIEIKGDENGILCTMKRRGRTAHSEFFGKKEASDMGLLSKDNYKKQAATMYRWRAVAACARTVFPDVILGLYLPEEMGADNVNALGELIPEPATVHKLPNKSKLVEAAKAIRAGNPLDEQIAELCSTLNKEADSIKWTSKTLSEYACEVLDLENYKDADDEMKNALIGDLEGRLDILRETAAINELNSSGHAIEGEVVSEGEKENFEEEVF